MTRKKAHKAQATQAQTTQANKVTQHAYVVQLVKTGKPTATIWQANDIEAARHAMWSIKAERKNIGTFHAVDNLTTALVLCQGYEVIQADAPIQTDAEIKEEVQSETIEEPTMSHELSHTMATIEQLKDAGDIAGLEALLEQLKAATKACYEALKLEPVKDEPKDEPIKDEPVKEDKKARFAKRHALVSAAKLAVEANPTLRSLLSRGLNSPNPELIAVLEAAKVQTQPQPEYIGKETNKKQSPMNIEYRKLQSLLKEARLGGATVNCKLNAKRETLQAEAVRLNLI